jgi:hypothetical protein
MKPTLTIRQRKLRLLRKVRGIEADLRSLQKKLKGQKDLVTLKLTTSAFLGLAEVFESYLEEDIYIGWGSSDRKIPLKSPGKYP